MKIADLIYGIGILDSDFLNPEQLVSNICYDSRKVEKNSIFVAINGVNMDGHQFISKAIELGAGVVFYESYEGPKSLDISWIRVKNTKLALSQLASAYYSNPSNEIKLVGVTGTNGKTTIATLLYRLFNSLGHKAGLFSTIRIMMGDKQIPATHTTPDPLIINRYLREMVDQGMEYCFMEVSSHGIDQDRTSSLRFAGGIFTNLSHDHLDYHKSFKEYSNVKKRFFDELPRDAFALTNVDDKNGSYMLQNTKAKKVTYSLKSVSDFKAKILEKHFNGMLLSVDNQELWTKLIGQFNAYNILAIYSCAVLLDQDAFEVLKVLSKLESVEGRFQYFTSQSGISVIVDYAHTPDALENVLSTIADIRTGNETLCTVVGCGGDRDKTKRPVMAKIACDNSNTVILTSDNPRSEDPMQIINDMEQGVEPHNYHKTTSIVDREMAIKLACSQSKPGDIVLIAGKGHETYQEIKGVKYDFDDFKIAKKILDLLNK